MDRATEDMTTDSFDDPPDAPSVEVLDRTIELVVPAATEFGQVVRLVAASLGADLELSVDEIDDVRLALGEVFAAAVDGDDGVQRLSFSMRADPDRLHVIVFGIGPAPIELDELAHTIVSAVTDELVADAGTIRFAKIAAERTTRAG